MRPSWPPAPPHDKTTTIDAVKAVKKALPAGRDRLLFAILLTWTAFPSAKMPARLDAIVRERVCKVHDNLRDPDTGTEIRTCQLTPSSLCLCVSVSPW